MDVQVTTTVAPLPLTAPTRPPSSIPTISQVQQAPAPTPTTLTPQDLPDFSSLFEFDHPQAKNEDFLNKLDENIQKIIKEQVKIQVFKILPKIEMIVNEQLEAKVLTRSSTSSKITYAVVADLSDLELKKILIEKMESNKRHDDSDKDEEPSARSDRGSKRRREGKEPESTSAPKKKESKTTGKSTEGSKSHQKTASESTPSEEPMQTTQDLEEPSHQEFEIDWNNLEGQQYSHNLLKSLQLIPNSQGRRIIPFDHFINNDLEYLRGGASSRKYTTSVKKTKAADYGHIKWIEDLFYGFAVNRESDRDVYSKRRIIVVIEL
nr:hypothetical protein [Tanacetum cinerariifolium]